MHRNHFPTGARCLESADAQECAPPGIGDALGQVVVPEHIADLHVLVIDRVVLTHEGERGLVVEVLSLPPHRLLRLR
jgi:hypothetical protein